MAGCRASKQRGCTKFNSNADEDSLTTTMTTMKMGLSRKQSAQNTQLGPD